MRKILVVLFACGSVIAGSMSVTSKHRVSAYADILLWLTFENGCPDTTSPYTLAGGEYINSACSGAPCAALVDVAGSGTPGSATAAAGAKIGSCGLALQGDGIQEHVAISFPITSSDIFTSDKGSVGMWFKPRASLSGYDTIFKAGGGGASTQVAGYYLGSSNTIELDIYDGTVDAFCDTGASAVAVGSWYFLEFKWDSASHTEIVKVTDDSGSPTITTTTCSATTFNMTTPQATLFLGGTRFQALSFYLDNTMVSNDYARDLTTERSRTSSPR